MLEGTSQEIFATVLKIAIPAVIFLWILIEYTSYVPKSNARVKLDKDGFPIDEKENFLDVRYRPIPVKWEDEPVGMDTDILRNITYNKDVVLSKYHELSYFQLNNIIQRITINNNKQYKMAELKPKLKPLIISEDDKEFYPNSKTTQIKLASGLIGEHKLHTKNIKFILATVIGLINKELLSHQKQTREVAIKLSTEKGSGLILKKEGNDMLSPYHEYQPFTILNHQLITYHTFMNDGKLLTRYILDIKIGRNNKPHQFVIQLDGLVINPKSPNILNKSLMISSQNIIGIPIEHTLDSQTEQGKHQSKLKDVSSELKRKPMRFGDMNKKILLEDVYIQEILSNKKVEGMFGNIDSNAKCFHPKGENGELPYETKLDCESYHVEAGGFGIWDAPCQKDEECPFYQANKNYPNSFGKCENNKCELPIGLERVGFRHYYKLTKPFCHNCSSSSVGDDNNCCDSQKELIKSKKIKMQTPDYMFVGDKQIRKENIDILKAQNLALSSKI